MQTISYMGTVDDVVLRYPSGDFKFKDSESFRSYQSKTIFDQLINAAIYDQKVAINDGYVVANELLLPALEEISRSLLGNMLISQSAVFLVGVIQRILLLGLSKAHSILQRIVR